MQEIQTTLPVGTIIRERYSVEGLLGKGGFGAVYLVRDQRVKGNLFALKEVIDPNKQERVRFTFECEVLKRLDHPALPRIYRAFEDPKNSRAYMLMDYIEGPNLEILRQKQPDKRFPLEQVLHIMTPIISAVSYLHSQQPPIIHRDIKPANIIVPDAGDEAMLVDFGIAKEYDPESTTTAVRRCSPGYGAPEQYSRGTNTQTDIYGLGATFYVLLTGLIPEDAFYRLTQIGSNGVDPLEPVNMLVPTIPPLVVNALQRAMALNSTERYRSVEQFWQALNAYRDVPARVPLVAPMIAPPAQAARTHQPQIEEIKTRIIPPEPQEPAERRYRLLPLVILILAVLALVGVGIAAFGPALLGQRVAVPTPAPVQQHKAIATATAKPTAVPTSAPTSAPTKVPTTPAAPTPSPSPVPPSYPSVAGIHYGSVKNTLANITANMTVSLQQNQGNIGGYVTIYAPLQGSGPLIYGNLQGNIIQFTVKGYNGNAPLYFNGRVNYDGSMGGYYCSLDSRTNQCSVHAGGYGSWNVGPANSGSSFVPSFVSPQANIEGSGISRDRSLWA